LVRRTALDGATSTAVVRPSQPWIDVAAAPNEFGVAGVYVRHGIEHILFGYDHLLFVAALILLVPNLRVLLATVTAFTFAHSITLALATLGLVEVPGPPVEATIALSIVILASEVGGERGLTALRPWLVAFSFGLLHGFGFASALTEVGLPSADVSLALLAFNVGVELGQVAFITVLVGATALAGRGEITERLAGQVRAAAPYGIGVLAAFWFCERLAGFVA
jgi:hydrogenase/urease accessory protein HupE